MTTQLSPGPWRTTPDAGNWNCSNDDNGSSCYQGIRDANGVVIGIAVAHDPNLWSSPDPGANARVMAAAHELRNALRDLVDAITGRANGETVALHNALAALRKADGA